MNLLLSNFENEVQSAILSFAKEDMNNFYIHHSNAGKIIKILAENKRIEEALFLEQIFYKKLVKIIETEDHYNKSFSIFKDELWNCGKHFSDKKNNFKPSKVIAFCIQSNAILGHTEATILVIQNLKLLYPDLKIYILSFDKKIFSGFKKIMNDLNVDIITPLVTFNSYLEVFRWGRKICQDFNIGTVIWVSVPTCVSCFFGYGLAYKQIYWALKFHAMYIDKSIIHIGWRGDGLNKTESIINGNLWKFFQPPLSINVTRNNKHTINVIRNKFPKTKIFGTLAREEKLNSKEFISTLIDILQKCPESIYVYTGRINSEILLKELKKFNLLDRCFYLGWVDTNLYSELIDIFLETFPAGCGITAVQSLFHGNTLISKWDDSTLPRLYFNDLTLAKKFSNNWKCALNREEYINCAIEAYNNKNQIQNDDTDIVKKIKLLDANKYQIFFNIINS
jgi:hypothetical protein